MPMLTTVWNFELFNISQKNLHFSTSDWQFISAGSS